MSKLKQPIELYDQVILVLLPSLITAIIYLFL